MNLFIECTSEENGKAIAIHVANIATFAPMDGGVGTRFVMVNGYQACVKESYLHVTKQLNEILKGCV